MSLKNIILLAIVAIIDISSIAQTTIAVNGVYYHLNPDGTAKVTYKPGERDSGGSYSGDVIILPSVSNNGKTYKVTAIGEYAFYLCENLRNVNIPNRITSIEADAFAKSNIRNLTIPESVDQIGKYAFFNCKGLVEIIIPEGVKIIEGGTFKNCKYLQKIIIPQSVTIIDYQAFWGCESLSNVVIPDEVDSIGEWAFFRCRNIERITLPNSAKKNRRSCF